LLHKLFHTVENISAKIQLVWKCVIISFLGQYIIMSNSYPAEPALWKQASEKKTDRKQYEKIKSLTETMEKCIVVR